jgi:O-antigen/teichoic acid export membrane protein
LGGNIFAQAIGIGSMFILAKYFYGPNELGVYAVFLSWSFILGIFGVLRLDFYLMIPKEESKALGLFKFASSFLFTFFFIFIALIYLFSLFIFFDITLWLFIAFGFFIQGVLSCFLFWNTRKEQWSNMAWAKSVGAISIFLFQLLFAISFRNVFSKSENYGLLTGNIIGSAFFIAWLAKEFPWTEFRKITFQESYQSVLEIFDMAKISFVSDLLNTISLQIPPILIQNIFGNAVAGQFHLANKIGGQPLQILNKSLSKVYAQEVSKAWHEDTTKISKINYLTLKYMVSILFFPMLGLMVFGPYMVNSIFGSKWEEAGHILKILVPLFFARTLYNPFSSLPELLRIPKIGFYFNLTLFFITIALFAMVYLLRIPLISFLWTYSIFLGGLYLGMTLYFYYKTNSVFLNESFDQNQ